MRKCLCHKDLRGFVYVFFASLPDGMGAKNCCFYADDTNYDTKNDTVFGTIVDTKLHNYGSFQKP